MKKSKGFVLSRKVFSDIKDAEKNALGLFNGGQLHQGTTLFEITAVYDLKIKFEKEMEEEGKCPLFLVSVTKL